MAGKEPCMVRMFGHPRKRVTSAIRHVPRAVISDGPARAHRLVGSTRSISSELIGETEWHSRSWPILLRFPEARGIRCGFPSHGFPLVLATAQPEDRNRRPL